MRTLVGTDPVAGRERAGRRHSQEQPEPCSLACTVLGGLTRDPEAWSWVSCGGGRRLRCAPGPPPEGMCGSPSFSLLSPRCRVTLSTESSRSTI